MVRLISIDRLKELEQQLKIFDNPEFGEIRRIKLADKEYAVDNYVA